MIVYFVLYFEINLLETYVCLSLPSKSVLIYHIYYDVG